MNTNTLTEAQQRLYREVLDRACKPGTPAWQILATADATDEDRAAVADQITPDAGQQWQP